MTTEWRDAATTIARLVADQRAYRRSCLNLIAAESITSRLVDEILASDFAHRYSSPGVYAGDEHFVRAAALTRGLVGRLFGARYVNLKPATGNLAVLAVVTGLTRRGDTVMKVGDRDGGYPIRLADWAGVRIASLPFDAERHNVDVERAIVAIRRERPRLVIFGASEFLYPHPVRELADVAREGGAVVAYDGSHVMGLIAGGEFQDPLREGADVLFGSTHKTLPGPQRGLIVGNDEGIMARLDDVLAPPPFLVSCYHLNTVVALGATAAEMLAFGRDYAAQTVRNARALARGLADRGVPVLTAGRGGTRSHQVILANGGFVSPEGIGIKDDLERCGILVDAVVRIGTQEVTRLGMREPEMARIADLMATVIQRRGREDDVRAEVRALAGRFSRVGFCFDETPTDGSVALADERPSGR